MEIRRIERALQELDSQHALRVSRIEVEMTRRGLQNSDARRQAIFEARLERLNQAIVQRLNIRKETVRSCPGLGSMAELKYLGDMMEAAVAELRAECQKGMIVPPEIFAELRAKVRDGIAAIRREAPMELPMTPKLPELPMSVSFGDTTKAKAAASVAGGERRPVPAAASGSTATRPRDRLTVASEKVEEAIGDLEPRNAALADALRRLAAAIHETASLGEERIVHLEQLQYVAEQGARVGVIRRVSVVKGILVALHAGLDDRPTLAKALRLADGLLTSHFGMEAAAIGSSPGSFSLHSE